MEKENKNAQNLSQETEKNCKLKQSCYLNISLKSLWWMHVTVLNILINRDW